MGSPNLPTLLREENNSSGDSGSFELEFGTLDSVSKNGLRLIELSTQTERAIVKKKSGRKRSAKPTMLPEKQWDMPAGFCSDGSTAATLREVVDPDQPTMQLSDLTLEQRAELVTKRLELQKEINLAMIGAGMIDKARAITEVKNKTKVGRLLIEIEHQMIRNLIEQSQKASGAAGTKSHGRAPSTTKSRSKAVLATKSRRRAAATTKTRRKTKG